MRFFLKGTNTTLGHLNSSLPLAATDKGQIVSLSTLLIDYDEANYKLEHRLVEIRKKCALNDLTSMLDTDEKIISHRFGIVTKDMSSIRQGTPVLEAITNQREIFVIYDEEKLTSKGLIESSAPTYNNEILLGNPLVILFVKTFATVLAKTVAKELLAKYFPPSEDEQIRAELKNLKEEIKKILQELKYENFEDTLITTRAWLRDTYSPRAAEAEKEGITKIDWQETIRELSVKQQLMKEVVDVIDTRLSNGELQNCDYFSRVKAGLYTGCACLRIILFREEIFLHRLAIEKGLVSYNIDSYVNELTSFIETAKDKIQNYSNKLKEGRYSKISDVSYHAIQHQHRTPDGMYIFIENKWFEWSDSFESNESRDPFRGPKLRTTYNVSSSDKDKKDQKDKADSEHNTHFDKVKELFQEHIETPFSLAVDNLANCKPIIK